MNPKETIAEDLKAAMKAKNTEETTVLRGLLSIFNNKVIEKRAKGGAEELSGEEQIGALQSEAKKRKEAIEAYQGAGRTELSEQEQRELEIIQRYLPQQLSEPELESIIDELLSGAESKEFGPLMRAVLERVKGQADGKAVSAILQKKLQG
ncbi:MAG: GatB/YqeY domain-containing protein [Candidatus Harrisonbacteria bacterium]|nr:GatB/YqeY domain-containing protein [Candidatus Harrisonbacteria bacterium]